jgi:WD40 repeat protein
VASGSRDETVKLWETSTGTLSVDWHLHSKATNVKSTQISLESSDDSGPLGVQSISYSPACQDLNRHVESEPPRRSPLSLGGSDSGGPFGVQSISYSPAGDMIAAGCKDGKIHLLTTSLRHVQDEVSYPRSLRPRHTSMRR